MQISDLVGQYHQTTTSGTDKLTGTKGVENLVASLRSLTKGNIFEGTVSSMKNGRVTLALSNGQQLSARMEGKVPLSVGQSMFFQVKSNDGTQIAIRPFVVDGNGVNYTLMTALNVAGLAVDADHLSMVNRMMQEQMPIDRNSLQQMARLVSANPDIDVQTLVQLKKLGIPITPENAAQFENYLDDKQAITDQMEHFIDELSQALQGGENPFCDFGESAGCSGAGGFFCCDGGCNRRNSVRGSIDAAGDDGRYSSVKYCGNRGRTDRRNDTNGSG